MIKTSEIEARHFDSGQEREISFKINGLSAIFIAQTREDRSHSRQTSKQALTSCFAILDERQAGLEGIADDIGEIFRDSRHSAFQGYFG
jgi:hypothetical protein